MILMGEWVESGEIGAISLYESRITNENKLSKQECWLESKEEESKSDRN